MPRIVSVIVLLIGLGVGAVYVVRAKQSYDKARAAIADGVLSVVPLDDETEALVAEVRSTWKKTYDLVGGPHFEGLKAVELAPTVSNLVYVFTYRMPGFSLFARKQNTRSALIGMVQAQLLPTAIDRSIHVSDDGRLAMIRAAENVVLLYSDEDGGLREAMYARMPAGSENR
jgi:hypothetical protein